MMVGVGGFAAWLLLGQTPSRDTSTERAARRAQAPNARAKSPRPPRPTSAERRPAATVAPTLKDPELIERRRAMVERYRRQSRFPPNSRPLTWSHGDLIEPNRRYERPKTDEDDPGFRYLLTADRYALIGDDSLDVTLQGWRNEDTVALQHVSAELQVVQPELGQPVEIGLTSERSRMSARLRPSALFDVSETVRARITTRFEDDRGVEHVDSINLEYTPDEAIPARFTAEYTEAIEKGSLRFRVGIDVRTSGYYVVEANLWSDGEPVAWTREKVDLSEGRDFVELEFFGKAIRESGLDGPYEIGQLRGFRFDEARAPDMDRVAASDDTVVYRSRAHSVDAFSDHPWDSEEKRRKLSALERATLVPRVERVRP